MTEFFQNCWQWALNNRDGIVAFFTSANFIAFLTTIVTIVKSIKSNTQTRVSNEKIVEGLNATTDVKSNVVELTVNNKASNEKLDALVAKQDAMQKQLDSFIENTTAKVNAMLEVQTIVYSTIKDDTMRNSVNTILIDAKHCESSAKAKLQEELEELKAKLVETTTKIATEISETVDNVENVMHVGVTEEVVTRRY